MCNLELPPPSSAPSAPSCVPLARWSSLSGLQILYLQDENNSKRSSGWL